ncbi:MAG TPA: methylcobamide--CoM methyltransferase [Actinomycetota bacterium]|nr:methylcobamide--CoM methyltransferase [Actinomycetota bacterium]
MGIRTTVVGSYPKPPEEGGQFVLRKTIHALDRGEADADDLRRAQDELVREVIAEQEAAGIDVVTDGQVRWDDIVTPFARRMAGFEIGGLLRFFDNNVYYRRPICTGPVEWRGPMSVDDWKAASEAASVPVKAVLPGPVTFAHLSIDEHYGDHETFTLALAEVLAQEAFELQAAGCATVQFDEPALLGAPEDLDLAKRAYGILTRDLEGAASIVATYFGSAKRLGRGLFDLPVDGFGLDLVAGAENEELLPELPSTMRLQAGIVDARNTKLEDTDELARRIASLAATVGEERLSVSPSCGLEFLPREKARAKLGRLVEAARKVEGR